MSLALAVGIGVLFAGARATRRAGTVLAGTSPVGYDWRRRLEPRGNSGSRASQAALPLSAVTARSG